MAVTRKTDLAGYRSQVSVGGYAAQHCLIPRKLSNPPQVIADTITCCPQRGRLRRPPLSYPPFKSR